ncbi:MAG: DUF2723 domain-containing protein, partial [candidate division Zixibacteria bacterium]|nr:DUF2723 domain-containing protein [candidate division Zixibacteria bacterium]
KDRKRGAVSAIMIIAGVSGGILAASAAILWEQSIINEVYSFSTILILLSIYFLVRAINVSLSKEVDKNILIKNSLPGFYFAGLALTNHLSSTALLVPLVFILYQLIISKSFNGRIMLLHVLVFIFPLTLYLYLPLRAINEPLMNWGNPVNFHNFWSHVTGWQYNVWMFNQSPEQLISKLKDALNMLLAQFGYISFPLAIAGMVFLLRKNRRLFYMFLFMILLNLVYTVNYDIPDIHSYYLPSIAVLGILAVTGIYYMLNMIDRGNLIGRALLVLLICAGMGVNAYSGYPRLGVRFQRLAGILNSDIMRSAQKDGFILTRNWDVYSPWLYNRYVKYIRPDLAMGDKELFRRSWYLDYLWDEHPEFRENIKEEFEKFREALYPFEHEMKYDSRLLSERFDKLINGVLETRSKLGPVYNTFFEDREITNRYNRIPEGLLFRLYQAEEAFLIPTPEFQFEREIDRGSLTREQIMLQGNSYTAMMRNRIKYLRFVGEEPAATDLIKRERKISAAVIEK